MTTDEQLTLDVRKELMNLAYKNLRASSIALIINGLIVAIVMWGSDKNHIIITSGVVFALLMILRIYTVRLHHKNRDQLPISLQETTFKRFAILTAAVVSISLLALFPYDNVMQQAFLTMIVAGLSAGSVMSLSTHKDMVKYYLSILTLPFAINMFLLLDTMHMLMGILIALFYLVMLAFSKHYHTNLISLASSKFTLENMHKELKNTQKNFYTIFEQAPVGVFTYDNDVIVKELNQAFADLLRTEQSKVVGLDMKELPDQIIRPAIDIVFDGEQGFFEGPYTTKISNTNIWISMRTVPMYDSNNKIIGGLGIVMDITDRIRNEQKIRQQAFFDSLTGLANRLTLHDRLEHQLARLKRHQRYGAILFIDLDHFKNINDTLGHHIGDSLLKTFAIRASSMVRSEDTVARLGGDEFVILLSDLGAEQNHAVEASFIVAEKLHAIMKEPIEIEQSIFHISISVGIAIIHEAYNDVNDVLKHADIAMYKAKQHGRNQTCIYQEEMSQKVQAQLELDRELRQALEKEEFILHFQPIVNTKTLEVVSCEALIRWEHPTRDLVFPDYFIPYAEESGLIIPIGEWVLERAIQEAKKYEGKLENIAVNISSPHFSQPDFVLKLLKLIQKYDLPPHMLKLELTESVALQNYESSIKTMEELKSHGFSLAMDDFGTGYSSLSYLKKLPFDYIKIDRAFINDILIDEDDEILVRTIISISKQFGFVVVAEGVESEAHIKMLQELECDRFQGYAISRPLSEQALEGYLTNN